MGRAVAAVDRRRGVGGRGPLGAPVFGHPRLGAALRHHGLGRTRRRPRGQRHAGAAPERAAGLRPQRGRDGGAGAFHQPRSGRRGPGDGGGRRRRRRLPTPAARGAQGPLGGGAVAGAPLRVRRLRPAHPTDPPRQVRGVQRRGPERGPVRGCRARGPSSSPADLLLLYPHRRLGGYGQPGLPPRGSRRSEKGAGAADGLGERRRRRRQRQQQRRRR
mmetsp:Transcript_18433/g.42062  ORF Transcript_18433/g.42062 Transcript_18433/m.42062 type:complete len:217 (-) Transcript_18433:1023-1673(-)